MKLLLVLTLLGIVFNQGFSADLTITPNMFGAEVVEAVVNIIRESCLFAEDKRFLRRLAYVESHDGTDPKTYRSGYDGGIWQVMLLFYSCRKLFVQFEDPFKTLICLI